MGVEPTTSTLARLRSAPELRPRNGGPGGNRTPDTPGADRVLWPLSYRPISKLKNEITASHRRRRARAGASTDMPGNKKPSAISREGFDLAILIRAVMSRMKPPGGIVRYYPSEDGIMACATTRRIRGSRSLAGILMSQTCADLVRRLRYCQGGILKLSEKCCTSRLVRGVGLAPAYPSD